MQKTQKTMVFYHVPQDHDDPASPNVFSVPAKKQSLTLQHIETHFPLQGSYVFRFKMSYDGLIVWLDLNNYDAPVPLYQQQVHIKANRLSWSSNKKPQEQPTQQSNKNITNSQPFSIFDHHQSQPHQQSRPSTQSKPQPQFQPQPQLNSTSPFDLNLLDHNGHTGKNEKVDFFASQTSPSSKKETNLMGFEAHGDLI